MTNRNAIAGIFGALAAGVIIGLLVAPEKGRDTRKKISQAAGDWAGGLSNLWSRGKLVAATNDGARQTRSGYRKKVSVKKA